MIHGEELMALSAFVLEDGVVYHTYTAYDRGTDVLNPTWQLLDRAPKGREDDAHRGLADGATTSTRRRRRTR